MNEETNNLEESKCSCGGDRVDGKCTREVIDLSPSDKIWDSFKKEMIEKKELEESRNCWIASDYFMGKLEDLLTTTTIKAKEEERQKVRDWADKNMSDGNWNYERLLLFLEKPTNKEFTTCKDCNRPKSEAHYHDCYPNK